MTQEFIKGCPSTSGDDYQLNTITFIKGAARTYPEVEVVSRRLDGSLFRYNYGEAYKRMQQLANALVKQGIKPGDRVAVVEWNTHRYWELYQAISGEKYVCRFDVPMEIPCSWALASPLATCSAISTISSMGNCPRRMCSLRFSPS